MAKNTRKTVATFALASFLNDLGAEMIYPIWPIFVTTVLGANMAVLGLIDGLSDAIVSLSQAFSGWLSDRIRKRKIFVVLGYLFSGLSKIGYAFAAVWQNLIPLRIFDRAGKIRDSPRDAIIADVSTRKNRGKNFGILRAMNNLGGVFGVIISIIFFATLGYRNLFLLAAIPPLIGTMFVLGAVKERKTKIKIHKGISFRNISKNLRLFMILSAIFALGSFSYSFLLVYAKKFGFSVIFIPVLYLIFVASASVFSIPFGKLADKIGRKQVLFISLSFWMLLCIIFILTDSQFMEYYYVLIIATFILYGLHKGALDPVQKTLVAELAPKEFRASTLGGFEMVIGLCALPASLGAGLLWDKVGFIAPFYLSLGLTIISMIMLLFLKEKH